MVTPTRHHINNRCDGALGQPAGRDLRPSPYAMSATAMTIGSETSEAREVTIVRVLKVPWVDSPSSDLNIQKKLLLTCSANIAPEAMARPMTIGDTLIDPSTGP